MVSIVTQRNKCEYQYVHCRSASLADLFELILLALRSRIGAKMTPENERGPPAGHPDASSISKASDASVAPVNPQEQLLLRGYQPLTQLGAGNFGRALLVLREELPYVAKMQRYHNLRLKDKRNILAT